MAHWSLEYCVLKTIEWTNLLVLSCLLGFLLAGHCITYKKVNKRCSLRVFRRPRVQILTLSLVLTSSMCLKATFIMDYGDQVIIVVSQSMRFLIWSLTLLNFMKSAASLIDSASIHITMKCLRICNIVGFGLFLVFAIVTVIMNETG